MLKQKIRQFYIILLISYKKNNTTYKKLLDYKNTTIKIPNILKSNSSTRSNI